MRQSEARSAGTIETMPGSLFADFASAVDAFVAEDEGAPE